MIFLILRQCIEYSKSIEIHFIRGNYEFSQAKHKFHTV